MAAHANSLTERVTKPVNDGAHVWSMPARDVRVFVDTLGRLGYDVASLLTSARLVIQISTMWMRGFRARRWEGSSRARSSSGSRQTSGSRSRG